jgi:hypothetical protein
MIVARSRNDRNNSLDNGTLIVIFRVNENNIPLFSLDQLAPITVNNAIGGINSYFSLYEPFQKFTFYPDITSSIEIGDLVTLSGSGGDNYRIVTASSDDRVIGTVLEINSGEVSISPFNKIIQNYSKPEDLIEGNIGTTWYNSGSGKITTTDTGDAKYYQLTNPIGTSITASYDNPEFDETNFNLYINNIEVIPQDAGGSFLSISEITSSINAFSSSTFVTSSIDEQGGGNAKAQTNDSAGTGGENGTLSSTYNGYVNNLFIVLGTGSPGSYPSAPGKFSITGSGYDFEVHPTISSVQAAGTYAVAHEEDIANAINTAAGSNPISASFATGSVKITETNGGTFEINKEVRDALNVDLVGNGSGTGLPTGEFTPPPLERYLTFERNDGGEILFSGSFVSSNTGSVGFVNTIGIPPKLLMIEASGGGGSDTDWFEGDTYLSASKDILITGSLEVSGSTTITGSTNILGDLRVYGTGSFNTIHTIYETSSIIYSSGSTKFGDTEDDTHQFTGSVTITGSLSVKDLTEDDTLTNVVVVDTTTGEFKYKEETTGSANNIYSSSLEDSIEMEEAVGGMPAGTTVGDLTLIESYNDLFDTILFPTGYPTLTAPSISATLSPSGLQIIGTEISSGNLSLTTTFNQGTIDPQYTATSGKRSGLPNTYNYSSTNTAFASSVSSTSLTDTVTNLLKYTVTAGANNFSVEVDHDAGVQPKDSKGNDFNSALSAGTVGPTTKTITGVYPVLATTSAIDTLTTQSLVVMTGYAEVDLVAEIFGQSDRQTVLIPTSVGSQAGWGTITIIEFFNTNSGNWEAINLNDWNITSSITKQIKGNPVNYTEFENKVGYPRGAGKYRFKA